MPDKTSKPNHPEDHPEHVDFPRVGSRARRWNRFERDLYEWMNRPEGQFECWLACRKVSAPVGTAGEHGN